MGRLEARYDVQLSVNLTLRDRVEGWRLQTTTSNIGLGGAFFAADSSPPDGSLIQTETAIPGHGIVFLPGRVIRTDSSGFAVKFDKLKNESQALLQKIIKEKLLSQEHCPACRNYLGENSRKCPFCNHTIGKDVEQDSTLNQTDKITDAHELIDLAMDRFLNDLVEIEKKGSANGFEKDANLYLQFIHEAVLRFTRECSRFERAVQDKDIIRNTQRRFRKKTDALALKSHFLKHVRTWPQGYVGDYKILEDIYRNIPLSEGVGFLLDHSFLATVLGKAVRGRKDMMRDLLANEIVGNSKLKILNIGCGSCRELIELATDIKASEAQITCLDFDAAALQFAAERIGLLELWSHFTLKKYNALKMINHERNIREFGQQDLIYSIGLLDYLNDDVLVRFIRAMYELLEPQGKFIAVFKDSDRYEPFEYHWVVDWDAFYQRKASESRSLIRRAGILEENISVERDRTGVILFYTIERKG